MGAVWRTLCFGMAVWWISQFMPCEGTGRLEIKFISYRSNCEDNKIFFSFFTSDCDTVFDICIDKPGVVDFSSCYYEYKATKKVHENNNEIDFQDTIGNIPNPRVIEFYNFQERRVMVAVKVTDDEAFQDDEHLATLSKTVRFTPAADKNSARWTQDVMSTVDDDYTYRMTFQFRAYCDAYYYTSMCDLYCRARNDSQGHYSCHPTTGQKQCFPGWTGSSCQTDINECLQGPCFNNANCTNFDGGYECRCSNGFIGKNCDLIGSQCYSSPCLHGGTCTGTKTYYSCTCPPEWTGENCHIMIDPCQSDPCQNNGTCSSTVGQYSCDCRPGWTGQNCVTEVNACDSLPCQHGGTCWRKPAAAYECSCTEHYEGQDCEVLKNPCDSNPCRNAGSCHSVSAVSYTCVCVEGWEGEHCERHTNYCATLPCKNGATCNSSDGGYVCFCSPDWKGDDCTIEINPCDDLPCQNGGTCTKMSGTQYTCRCSKEYEGKNCEILTDLCATNPCRNDATCVNADSGYVCHCALGWKGEHCETEDNPCDDLPCQNGGVCTTTSGMQYKCSCPVQYEGQNCEKPRDPCRSNPCYHGTCQRLSHSLFKCLCDRQWSGTYCHRTSLEKEPALRMGENNDKKKPPVLYIILGCLSMGLLLIIVLILLVFRRRRRRKTTAKDGAGRTGSRSDSVSTITTVVGDTGVVMGSPTFLSLSPPNPSGFPAVGFQTRLYSPTNVCKDRLWSRPQMPLPTSPLPRAGCGYGEGEDPGEVFYPGKAVRSRSVGARGETGEGAVGGRVETCSLKGGVVSWRKSSGPQTGRERAGRGKSAANDYTDFAELQRRSDASRRTAQEPVMEEDDAEESHYHTLDDLSLAGSHYPTGGGVPPKRTMVQEAALEDLPSTDEEDGDVTQEDLNRLRQDVLQRSINRY